MIHFCIFGGREGQLSPGRNIYITLFGGTVFRRPAMAHQLVKGAQNPGGHGTFCFFFTAFGATEIKWPTLAEEYLALLEAVRGGALTLGEWDRASAQSSSGAPRHTASFTIFGGLDTDALPNEDEELDDLGLQRHAGRVPEVALESLMLAVGHGGAQRLAAVRQAVAATLAET